MLFIPVLANYNPEFSGMSFLDVWTSNKFYLYSEGNAAKILIGVWIGGTPASWITMSCLNLLSKQVN